MAKIITSKSLYREQLESFSKGNLVRVKDRNAVSIVGSHLKELAPGATVNKVIDNTEAGLISSASRVDLERPISLSGQYDSGYDVPFGDRGSINQRIRQGKFDQNMPQNWKDLWDATRLDITIRKQARQTVRQFIYNITSVPNASPTMNITELYPKAIVFKKNNGQGQAINQGSNLGGETDTVSMELFATGYAHTLWAELFDRSSDLSRMNDGVALAHNAILDHNALYPIITADYGAAGTAKHTAASTVGDNRYEKLYYTLSNMTDDFSERVDPITQRKIDVSDLIILANTYDLRHIRQVINGEINRPADSKNLGRISDISTLVGYDGDKIQDVNEVIDYPGVPKGTIFAITRNRYMQIAQKTGLVMEVDPQPDLEKLKKTQRAWYFCEGIYNAKGIENFVQKCTLPAWTTA